MAGENIVGATTSDYVSLNQPTRAKLVTEVGTLPTQINLVLKNGPTGNAVVVSSTHYVGNLTAVDLDLPAGEYAIQNVASTALAVYASLYPTR